METGRASISIAGTWSLEDWYTYPRTVGQVYAFQHSILSISERPDSLEDDGRLTITYRAHPWTGGFSALNFFKYLEAAVPPQERPRVLSIRYSSPGALELGLAVSAFASVRLIVKSICASGRDLNDLYSEIHKGLRDRKLSKISVKREELRLKGEELEFLESSTNQLSRLMGLSEVAELQRAAPNHLAALKILLSVYRRYRTLAAYETDGKASIDE